MSDMGSLTLILWGFLPCRQRKQDASREKVIGAVMLGGLPCKEREQRLAVLKVCCRGVFKRSEFVNMLMQSASFQFGDVQEPSNWLCLSMVDSQKTTCCKFRPKCTIKRRWKQTATLFLTHRGVALLLVAKMPTRCKLCVWTRSTRSVSSQEQIHEVETIRS